MVTSIDAKSHGIDNPIQPYSEIMYPELMDKRSAEDIKTEIVKKLTE